MVRRVAVRTVANAQEASDSLSQRASTPSSPIAQIAPDDPRLQYTRQVRDQLIDPGGIPLMYQSDINPRYETQLNPNYDVGVANAYATQQHLWPTAPVDYRQWGAQTPPSDSSAEDLALDRLQNQRTRGDLFPLGGYFDALGIDSQRSFLEGRALGDEQGRRVFEMLQVNMATAQAVADSMIQSAVQNAGLAYDDALRQIDRDILDTAGKFDDLDKIADHYRAKMVGPWEKAAAEARAVDSTDIAKQAAATVAAVGEQFDLADAETQAYLDRIGGVPVAQQVAITDTIQYLMNPYEGLAEAEAQMLGSVVDARGTLLEKQAIRGLTAHNLSVETDRFLINDALSDDLEAMNLERQDIIGQRTRAIKAAREQAEQQYGFTGLMPARDDVLQMAGNALLNDLGVDPLVQPAYWNMYSAIRTGQFVAGYKSVFDPVTGAQLFEDDDVTPLKGEPIVIDTTDPVQFQVEYMKLPAAYKDEEDLAILLPLLYTMDRTGAMWDSKDSQYRSVGSAAPPNNWANRNEPAYVTRRNITTNMIPVILDKFPGLHVTSQSRSLEHNQEIGGAANSDHLSGGALDLGFSSKAEADEAAAWLSSLPNTRIVLWQVKGHYDHIHVSFKMPDNIGDQAVVNDFMDSTWTTDEVVGQDAQTQISGSVDPATREYIRKAFAN